MRDYAVIAFVRGIAMCDWLTATGDCIMTICVCVVIMRNCRSAICNCIMTICVCVAIMRNCRSAICNCIMTICDWHDGSDRHGNRLLNLWGGRCGVTVRVKEWLISPKCCIGFPIFLSHGHHGGNMAFSLQNYLGLNHEIFEHCDHLVVCMYTLWLPITQSFGVVSAQ